MGTLLRACGKGSQSSCTIAKAVRAMYAGSSVSFSSASKGMDDHPNKMPFSAVLLVCDEPSDKPPHGSQGHRIMVPSSVAKDKLSGLPGMAVNYDPSDMDEHVTRHKVGVITKAWMEGPEVKISGFVWKKDFPEAERDLKRKDLGTSMELADVYVDDENRDVWKLTDFAFTGATILKRNAAAYTKTSLTASREGRGASEEGEHVMSKNRKVAAASNKSNGISVKALSKSLGPALMQALAPVVSEIKAQGQRLEERQNQFIEEQRGLRMLEAAADNDDDEIVLHAKGKKMDESDDDMDAASDESDDMNAASDESDDMAAASDDDASSDDMAAAMNDSDDSASDNSSSDASDLAAMEDMGLDPADQEPGQVNKEASNRGHKTTVTKPPKQGEHFPGNVAKGRLHSSGKKGKGMSKPFPGLDAAADIVHRVTADNKKLRRVIQAQAQQNGKTIKKLRNRLETVQAQVEHFAEKEGRRSVASVELVNLAAKAGYNLSEIKASGQKFDVSTVDHIFAVAASQGINIEPEQRIAMKNLLEQEGMMGDGAIVRNYGR